MISRTVVSMFSHESRADARWETITALEAVGVTVDHVEISDGRPRQAKVRRGAWGAIKYSVQLVAPKVEGAAGVLVLEDDIVPAETIGAWVKHFEDEHQHQPVTLYITPRDYLYPLRLRRVARGERRPTKSEVATVADLRHWWGSQAVWLPLWFAKEVVRDQRLQAHEAGLGPWDHALRTILQERGMTLGVTVPSIVQHRGLRNVVLPRKTPHESSAYDSQATPPSGIGEE